MRPGFIGGQGIVVLGQSAEPVSVTGSTSEVNQAVVNVPGGLVGPNGRIRISAFWSATNNANAKTARVRLGGSQFWGQSIASALSWKLDYNVQNRGSLNAQAGDFNTSTIFGGSGSAVIVGAVDTALDQVLVLSIQLANGADVCTLERYSIEVLRG